MFPLKNLARKGLKVNSCLGICRTSWAMSNIVVINLQCQAISCYNDGPIQGLYTLIARFMGPTWGPSGADSTQVGPMLAPWSLLSGYIHKANSVMMKALFYRKVIIFQVQVKAYFLFLLLCNVISHFWVHWPFCWYFYHQRCISLHTEYVLVSS